MIKEDIDWFWQQLLAFVKEGRVIPVIGPELLVLEIDGQKVTLYDYLAEQLNRQLGLEIEPPVTLNAVVCRHLDKEGKEAWEDIYTRVNMAVNALAAVEPPAALRKLAEITPLKLFVTICFDPYLTQALNRVRYHGRNETQVIEFNCKSHNDLPISYSNLSHTTTTVFHLFGKLSATPCFAVSDEDILEFLHLLQSKENQPHRLFDALLQENLMVIGCPFSDWQARFFVRLNKKERLMVSSGKVDFLVGNQIQHDQRLAEFLHYFSRRTKLFPMDSLQFIDQLHAKWLALQKSEPDLGPTTPDYTPPPPDIQSGAVFLSYAHEDIDAVSKIRDSLEGIGIDVWFDKTPQALKPGDPFDMVIKNNIEQSSVFIPVISKQTLIGQARYFRLEWEHALWFSHQFPETKRFVLPIVIDDTPYDQPAIDADLRKLHWERVENGECSKLLLADIKELQRIHRLENQR